MVAITRGTWRAPRDFSAGRRKRLPRACNGARNRASAAAMVHVVCDGAIYSRFKVISVSFWKW